MPITENIRFAVQDAGDVSAVLLRPQSAECVLVLAPGAGAGGMASFLFQFLYMEQRRRVPDRAPVLTATIQAAVHAASEAAPDLPLFAGGKSLGGRMTSLAAAEHGLDNVRGLGIFGFALPPPT